MTVHAILSDLADARAILSLVRPPDAAAVRIASLARDDEAAPVDRVHTLWRAVDRDLSPVIGRRGTAAMLRRALFTARRTHPWLPAPSEDTGFDACIESLVRAFSRQCAGEADEADAATRLLETAFSEQLSSLVGVSLTAQLLQSAWSLRPPGRAG